MAWRLKEEKKDVRNIFNLLKKRDFSSYTGLAIKNSVLQTTTLIISKIGSLVFTVIIARLLLPELFGLYSLALSTIILLSTFTDLGTSQTLVRYVSLSLSKKNKGIAKGYLIYLTKIKLILTFLSIFILLALAKFIYNTYYHYIFTKKTYFYRDRFIFYYHVFIFMLFIYNDIFLFFSQEKDSLY